MAKSTDANTVLEALDRFDESATAFAAHLKKVRARLSRARKAFAGNPASCEITKLVGDLGRYAATPAAPNVAALIEELEKRLNEFRHSLSGSFAELLQKACAAEQIAFRRIADGFGIGPFHLSVNPAKEQGVLSYAKVVVAKEIAMEAAACVAEANANKASILDAPSDIVKLRLEFEEAVRVALARQNKPTRGDLRVELPRVFRELELMRHAKPNPKGKAGSRYSIPRFVVEISRLVRSEANIESKKPFRLETAVLENAKDSRRSVFIPKHRGLNNLPTDHPASAIKSGGETTYRVIEFGTLFNPRC